MTHNILIVGGTGSLGSALTEFYHDKGWNVTVFSRDGHKQQALGMKFPDVNFVLGDICDKDAMRFALEGQHYVVNAAAQKIVSQGQAFVDEFIRVNIEGGLSVAKLCYDLDIPVVIQISSDKACEPINLYGVTKAVNEEIAIQYGYTALRYGNISDSNSGFMDVWKKIIFSSNDVRTISVRRPNPTRFFMTISDAVALVDECVNIATGGEIFVPRELVSFNIGDIARYMKKKYDVDIEYSDLLPAEKQHEVLIAKAEYGVPISDLLVRVYKGYVFEDTGIDYSDYHSGTAKRIDAERFMELYGDFNG